MNSGTGPSRPAIPFVLASESPRRRLLLTEAGCDFEVVAPGLDDAHLSPGSSTPASWVSALAFLKATAAARALGRSETRPVVGADTVCVLDGEVIGKPNDRSSATRMIQSFADRSHEVLTGVAIVSPHTGHREIFCERAVVTLGELSDEMIDAYAKSDNWVGKAGGYNFTERIEAGWPLTCEGDQNTVVGLPVAALLERLSAWPESSQV